MRYEITEITTDFDDMGSNDSCEISIATTQGTFTIWVQTHGQRDGELSVELGRGEQNKCHTVMKD